MNLGWKMFATNRLVVFSVFLMCTVCYSEKMKSTMEKKQNSPKFRKYEDLDRVFNKKVAQKRKEEADYIKKLLRKSKYSKKNKAIFHMRLAELYWDQARYEFDLETARYGKSYEKWKKDKIGSEPRVDNSNSTRLYKLSINIAKMVLKSKPKEKYRRKALYFLGFNQIELGNGADGIKYLKMLVNDYNGGPYYAEAMLRMADFYFDKSQPMVARTYYKKLLNSGDVNLKSYVLYKIAWTYMKTGQGAKALSGFKKVRIHILKNGNKKKIGLLEEAEKDMLKAFVLYNNAGKVKKFIEKNFGFSSAKKTRERYEYLASLYKLKKVRSSAALMYYEIIDLDPMNEKNIDIEVMLFDLFQNPFNLNYAYKQISRVAKRYGPGSAWYSKHGKKAKILVKLEEMMRISATKTHEYSVKLIKSRKQKVSKATAYKPTIEMYSKYLKVFPKHKNSYEIRYVYAQILFDLKMYRKAAAEYDVLFEMNPSGKYAKLSALNSVVCVESLLPKVKEKKDLKKYQISKVETDFIKVSQRYISEFPRDLKVVDELKYKQAMIYYSNNHFDNAIKIFEYFINKSKNSKLKKASINNMMIIYDRKKDNKGLGVFLAKIISQPSMSKLSKDLNLDKIYEKSQLKIASDLEKDGNNKEAADLYFTFYNKFPKSDNRKKALYNSLVLYKKAKLVEMENKLHLIFINNYPNDSVSVNSYKSLAEYYKNIGEFEKSANFYLSLYNSNLIKNNKQNIALIFNSATFYNLANEEDTAIKYYNLIESKYPGSHEAVDSILARAKIAEADKDYQKAISIYEKYFKLVKVSQDDLAFYYAKFASWYFSKLEYPEKGEMYYNKILLMNPKNLKSGIDYYAEAKFYKLERDFNNFLTFKEVAYIGKKIQELVDEYNAVANLGSSKWWVASIIRVGAIYEHFGRKIADAPLPSAKELQGASLADYKKEINNLVSGNLKTAEEFYRKAINEAEKSAVLSKHLLEARKRFSMVKGQLAEATPIFPEKKYIVITDNTKDVIYYEKRM